MRLGVVPALDPAAGGLYQYSLTMLEQLDALVLEDPNLADPVLLTEARSRQVAPTVAFAAWEHRPLDPPSASGRATRLVKKIVPPGAIRFGLPGRPQRETAVGGPLDRAQQRRWLAGLGLDALLFAAPDPRSVEIALPFVMPVHDLQHRLQPEFPEVSEGGEFERREYLYRNAARTARALLVDSETGKEDLLELYADEGIEKDRIFVLPFLPPPRPPLPEHGRADLVSNLPDRFLFYPAQFWPHKNHRRLVEALALLKEEGLEVSLVLTGSTSGKLRKRTFQEAMTRAAELGVVHQISCLGYVDDSDMSVLYDRALALVFPTFFGPTNIPIIEAWTVGCPVVTSDIRGVREQVGDAGLLVSPESVEAIAEGIHSVWSDPSLRKRLVDRGLQKVNGYTSADYRSRLRAALSAIVD